MQQPPPRRSLDVQRPVFEQPLVVGDAPQPRGSALRIANRRGRENGASGRDRACVSLSSGLQRGRDRASARQQRPAVPPSTRQVSLSLRSRVCRRRPIRESPYTRRQRVRFRVRHRRTQHQRSRIAYPDSKLVALQQRYRLRKRRASSADDDLEWRRPPRRRRSLGVVELVFRLSVATSGGESSHNARAADKHARVERQGVSIKSDGSIGIEVCDLIADLTVCLGVRPVDRDRLLQVVEAIRKTIGCERERQIGFRRIGRELDTPARPRA